MLVNVETQSLRDCFFSATMRLMMRHLDMYTRLKINETKLLLRLFFHRNKNKKMTLTLMPYPPRVHNRLRQPQVVVTNPN